MSHSARAGRRSIRGALLLTMSLVLAGAAPASATAAGTVSGVSFERGEVAVTQGWTWPVHPFQLERPFVAPPHPYGPGHRGVDLRPGAGDVVSAPAAGVVAFSGQVAGRGILTIDHGDGLVTTLEPVVSELPPGTPVAAAAPVGRLSSGGHVPSGVLHFGVRLNGDYINPLVLLGGVPRAVLLPCC